MFGLRAGRYLPGALFKEVLEGLGPGALGGGNSGLLQKERVPVAQWWRASSWQRNAFRSPCSANTNKGKDKPPGYLAYTLFLS